MSLLSLPDELLENLLVSITAVAPHPIPPTKPTQRMRLIATPQIHRAMRVCKTFTRVAQRPSCHVVIFIDHRDLLDDSALDRCLRLAAGGCKQLWVHSASLVTCQGLMRLHEQQDLRRLFLQGCAKVRLTTLLPLPPSLRELSILGTAVVDEADIWELTGEDSPTRIRGELTLDVALCPACKRVQARRKVHACACGAIGCETCTHIRCATCGENIGCLECAHGDWKDRIRCSTPHCTEFLCADCVGEIPCECDDCGSVFCPTCISARSDDTHESEWWRGAVPGECRRSSFVSATGRCHRVKTHRFDSHREWSVEAGSSAE